MDIVSTCDREIQTSENENDDDDDDDVVVVEDDSYEELKHKIASACAKKIRNIHLLTKYMRRTFVDRRKEICKLDEDDELHVYRLIQMFPCFDQSRYVSFINATRYNFI